MVSMFALGLSTSGFEPGRGHCCEHSWAIYVGYSPSFSVKMAGYWPSSFLRVYGLRQSQGP